MSSQTEHINDEVLTDLAMGLLPSSHAQPVLAHLTSCSACEERFREIAAEWEHAAVRVDEILSQAAKADRTRASTLSAWDLYVKPNIRWAATAVVLIVVALIVPMLVPDSDESPALTKLPPLTQDVLQRAVISGEQNDILMQGLDAYAEEDLDGAIESLEVVRTEGPIDALRRIYLASALARKARYQEALDVLAPVPIDLVPDPWASEAQWTQYVAYDRTAQPDRAGAVLQALSKQPGAAGDRARAIIESRK